MNRGDDEYPNMSWLVELKCGGISNIHPGNIPQPTMRELYEEYDGTLTLGEWNDLLERMNIL